jgi:hypothetical protein
MTNEYVSKATDFEKLNWIEFNMEEYLSGKGSYSKMSGVTQDIQAVEDSSLLGDAPPSKTMNPPNFITECFFLCHIAISFVTKKMEQIYMKNHEELNKAIQAKSYGDFDEIMAHRLCYDAHIFGKQTNQLYR